jgi:hypothetical protein
MRMRRQLPWIAPAALVAVAMVADLGCAESRKSRKDDDDDGSGASSVSAGGASAVAVGAGGSMAQQVTATGTGGTPPPPCEYPPPPYGVAQGQVVPPTLSWQGYAPGNGSVTTVSIQDFFDCDGTKGIRAVMVDTSQYG